MALETTSDGGVVLHGHTFYLTVDPVGNLEIETKGPTPVWVLRELIGTLEVEWGEATKKTLDWLRGEES